MRCPECDSTDIYLISDAYDVHRCRDCGFSGEGEVFEGGPIDDYLDYYADAHPDPTDSLADDPTEATDFAWHWDS